MSLILALDSATKALSVALLEDGQCHAHTYELSDGYRHAERLHVAIDELMTKAGRRPNDLSAILLGGGPGSYTGLRIGTSSAKGMAYALDIPIIQCPTLQVMAAKAASHVGDGLLMPMLDARRMEVYTAIYNRNLELRSPISAEIIDEDWSPSLEERPIYLFGDGMPKCKELLQAKEGLFFIDDIGPDMSAMATVAQRAFETEDFVDTAYFEPSYLKEFKAGKPKKLL